MSNPHEEYSLGHIASRPIRCCLGMVLFAAMCSASAQDRQLVKSIVINGVGGLSCGKYLEFRKTGNNEMTSRFQQWAAGYFAGYSDGVTKAGMKTDLAPDLETYTAWLDKWCAEEPTSDVYAGLVKLKTKLEVRK
jgi:hypothetical protein